MSLVKAVGSCGDRAGQPEETEIDVGEEWVEQLGQLRLQLVSALRYPCLLIVS